MTEKPKFGTRAEDYVPTEIDPDDIWIKTFKVGETRHRILQDTKDWITWREHYDPALRLSYPCTEDSSSCKGCTSDVERVRQRPRRYGYNALNDKGHLSVYKMGSKLKERLAGREQRQGTLTDRDYTIIRTGTTMDTTEYDYEYGDRYEVDTKELELYDIQDILAGQYLKALEAYGAKDEGEPADDSAHDASVTPIDKAKTTKKDEPADNEPVEDWPLSRLKAFLENERVEFPARAARSVLVPLVQEVLASDQKTGEPPF
jgi:hypothetical protein